MKLRSRRMVAGRERDQWHGNVKRCDDQWRDQEKIEPLEHLQGCREELKSTSQHI